MKTTLLAFALAFAALPCLSQDGPRPPVSEDKVMTDLGADRRDKKGTAQTFNTGMTGEGVGVDPSKSQEATVKGGGVPGKTPDAAAGEKPSGAGVATGFVAAGFGLALIGLFVKRNGRHPDDHFD